MMYAKNRGIVVRKIDYGESDEIVHLRCVSEGKLHRVAKGSRASRKRFVNSLELYNEMDFEYGRKKGRDGEVSFSSRARTWSRLNLEISTEAIGQTLLRHTLRR